MIIRQGGGDWSVMTRTVAWRIKRVPCLRRKVHAWPCGPEQHIPPPSNAEPHLAFWDWWKGQACPGPPTIPVTAQPLLCLQYPDRSSLPCLYRVCDTPPLSSSSQRLLFQPPSPPYPTFQFPALVNNPLHNTTVPLAPRSCMHRTGMLTSSPVPLLLIASVWCVQMPQTTGSQNGVLDEQRHHHLVPVPEADSQPSPDILSQKVNTQEVEPMTCGLTSPPGDSDTGQ